VPEGDYICQKKRSNPEERIPTHMLSIHKNLLILLSLRVRNVTAKTTKRTTAQNINFSLDFR
jgi:hypothetical protein